MLTHFVGAQQGQIHLPAIMMQEVENEVRINMQSGIREAVLLYDGKEVSFKREGEMLVATFTLEKRTTITVQSDQGNFSYEVNPISLWLSLLPPLLAILLALLFKEVITALLIGLFSGILILQFYQHDFLPAAFYSFMRLIDTYILEAVADPGHLSIIIFSMLIGAMVHVITENGGMQGVVKSISRYARSPRSGQMATYLLGITIFFDDYANTLVVGNTMRPITDKLRISREKLAYLVDSTAAPIAAIAFITTWIGAELSYIEAGINRIEDLNEGVYSIFIQSLAYSFYPVFSLIFMFFLIRSGKDFGPMWKAEQAARLQASTEPSATSESKPVSTSPWNAIIPVAVVVLGTIIGLLYTGWDSDIWQDGEINLGKKLSLIIGQSDSYQALLWASLAALATAIKLSVFQKLMSLSKAMEAAVEGMKTMLSAILILVLAWSLAQVIEELHTADLLTSVLSDTISPYLIPTLTFILAALVAFSTGSSWGTMAILYPLMLGASWSISREAGLDYQSSLSIFQNVVACVLAGSVLGDHCSPISDTTILSSLSSKCDHLSHVRTQMPYALTVGSIAVLAGTLPTAYGLPSWLAFLAGGGILWLIIHKFGKSVEESLPG
jgi:Na+/H+ antiporter NhaC